MKYSFIALAFLLTISLFGFISLNHLKNELSHYTAKNGLIDLNGVDFDEQKIVELNGDWEFYWHQLIAPKDFKTDNTHRNYFAVPCLWNNKKINGTVQNGIGYATYRLNIKTKASKEILGIKTQRIENAYCIWVDGELKFKTGTVSTNKNSAKAYWFPTEVFFKDEIPNHEIVIQVSNFHHRKGGISGSLFIGSSSAILSKTAEINGLTLFIIGALLIIGLYHLGLFSLRPNDKSTLYFGITCLLTALNSLTAGEFLIVKLIYGFNWDWIVKINYMTNFMRICFFSLFLGFIFPNRLEKRFNQYLLYVLSLLSIVVLFTKPLFFTHLITTFEVLVLIMMLYWLVNLGKAAIQRKKEASLSIIGTVILFATAVNDILHDSMQLHTVDMVSFGLFIFVLFQAIMLSIRTSNTMNSVETLSEKLLILDKIKNEFLKNTTHDLSRHLQIIIQNLNADKGILLLNENGKLCINSIAFMDGKPEKYENLPFDLTDKNLEKHILPKSLINKSIQSESNTSYSKGDRKKETSESYFESNPIQSAVSIPLFEDNQLIGVIYLENSNEDVFSEEKLNVIDLLKSQFATIIENDKIYEQLESLNKNLERKVAERTTEVMQQKEEIIAQKDELEETSEILREALSEISHKNRDITDSINYAKRIQDSIFPNTAFLKALLPESFIFFKPKHILSGDFYWFDTFFNAETPDQLKTEKLIIAAVDCTGHGVPGALMSIIGNNMLHHAMNEMKITRPDEILKELQKEIRTKFKSSETSDYGHDGMDLAIISYEFATKKLLFAGAKNPLIHFRDKHMTIYNGSQSSIGGFHKNEQTGFDFECHEIKIETNDVVYIFSDGFMDQIGGANKRKLMRKGFYELINSIHHQKMGRQIDMLRTSFDEWKENHAQVDDVLVIGIRFS